MIFKGMSTRQFLKNTVVDTTATRPHILQKLYRNQRLVMSQTAECVQMFSKSHRSPLSTEYTRDDVTVTVDIQQTFREAGWRLEVTSADGQVTEWNSAFATDHEAYDEFLYVVETEGIEVFI